MLKSFIWEIPSGFDPYNGLRPSDLCRHWTILFTLFGGRTVYPKKYAHGFCFAVLCCGYTLTDFPISIRLTSLALWQSNDCPSASKATLMNMDKYFMWIHYERLHNHNKAKHNKTVCKFLGIYCTFKVTTVSKWISWVIQIYVTTRYDTFEHKLRGSKIEYTPLLDLSETPPIVTDEFMPMISYKRI